MRRILERNEILQLPKNFVYLTLQFITNPCLYLLYKNYKTVEKPAPFQTNVTGHSNTDCIRGVHHGYYNQEHGLQVRAVNTAVRSVAPYGVASAHITANTELRPFCGMNREGLHLFNEIIGISGCFRYRAGSLNFNNCTYFVHNFIYTYAVTCVAYERLPITKHELQLHFILDLNV